MSDRQREAVFAMLRAMGGRGRDWRNRLLRTDKANATLQVAGKAGFLEVDAVAGFGYKNKGAFPSDQYMLIAPPARETATVCAVSCCWDFTGGEPQMSCYLGIWTPRPVELEVSPPGPKRPIVFLGYRYETPDTDGVKHRFYHAQPCRSMDPGRRDIPNAVPHHTGMPTFQLVALEPAELLVSVEISLYGLGHVGDLVVELKELSFPKAPNDFIDRVKSWPARR